MNKHSIHIAKKPDKILTKLIILSAFVSLFFFFILCSLSQTVSLPYSNEMLKASGIMADAISIIQKHCEENGIEIDETIDPNKTGLIGPELTGLTTTLGHADVKRTTTNPNMAGLIVHLMKQAGVQKRDTVAVGCSASFPALMIASIAACKAIEVHPVVIISLGASSFGATRLDFNLLDIYGLLYEKGIFDCLPAAVSLGGEKDIGELYKNEDKEKLIKQIADTFIPFLYQEDLRKNVKQRMDIYMGITGNGNISAFINTGGNYANMGTSSLILNMKPGLNVNAQLPPVEQRGVIFEMIAQDIPVIHLLFIKGLALNHNLEWDPIPLPEPGKSRIYESSGNVVFLVITAVYFILLFILILYGYSKKDPKKNK